MFESLLQQLVAVFSTGTGLTVLSLAVLASVGIIVGFLWRHNRKPTQPSVTAIPAKVVPPPLLAPEIFRGGASSVQPADNSLRNLLLGLLGIMAALVAVQFIFVGSRAKTPVAPPVIAQPKPTPGPTAPGSDIVATPVRANPLDCIEGPVRPDPEEHDGAVHYVPISYRVCVGSRLAADFDLLNFRREGVELVEAAWMPAAYPLISAANQPSSFGLDNETVDIVPAPGAAYEDYDVFLAVGMAGFDIDDAAASQRSANRAFHIARYVLNELRAHPVSGDILPEDCRSPAQVYAVSAGRYTGGGNVAAAEDVANAAKARAAAKDGGALANTFDPVRPILIGLKFDKKVAPRDRDADAAIAAFMRSQGVNITGYNLRTFEPRQILFREEACPRAEIH